ncbi:uncharacterized protein si:ch211-286b5.2 isoform X1 [Anguilla rostrata]|uniref:uncharacterized protein si:ch211-286b5.2 isoform X1 n=1 Tax=Anguilla rostrata TaxID=7938 RepID=UPI0030D52194
MTKRGVPQAATGKATQPRTLRARKRKLETAPPGHNETLQSGEPHGSSVCVPTSSGVGESSALLSKDVKASNSCTEVQSTSGEAKPLQLDCTTAQRERGEDCTTAKREALRSGEMGRREEGAEIQEYPSATPSHPALCPPGSPLPASDGREVGRRPGATDGVTGEDGEKEKPTDGPGDHPSDQPHLGEGKATAPDPEPLRSALGDQCEDGPAKKKVRKRMGVRGFGERERRTHCEGQLGSRHQKNGESEKGRERERKVDQEYEEHSDCHEEVTWKSLEKPTSSIAANGTNLGTAEGMPDTALGLAGQPEVPRSASDLSLPIPLDSVLEEEEPSQPELEGSDKIPEQPFTVGKTVAGETKSGHSATYSEKTTGGEGTRPCGPGEASEEDGLVVSGGGSRESHVELGGATCQEWGDVRRCTGSPCSVQAEDCDLRVTALEEVGQGQGRCGTGRVQQREAPKVLGCSSCEPEITLGLNPLESGTLPVPCDGVAREPFEGIRLLDPSSFVASQTSDGVEGAGFAGGTDLASCGPQGPGEKSGPVAPVGEVCVGQGSSQGCASLSQGAPVTEDIREPPGLREEPHGDREDAIATHSHDPARLLEEPHAPGLTGPGASPEERRHPTAHRGPVSLEVHLSRANHTETQRTSDQASLGASTGNRDQHQDSGETGSGSGHPGPVCASVLPPVCEDKPLHRDTELVSSFNTRPFTALSPKPSGDPDPDPEAPTSPSDSQLNNIALSEMEDSPTPDDADQQEDASDLVCGLIKELSFLNRTVMAAHRELDNIRRGNKAPKAAPWRSYGSRRSEI